MMDDDGVDDEDAQVGGEGGREEWGLVNTLTRLVNTLNTW